MAEGGSCVVFWLDDFRRLPRDTPSAISFVQALPLSKVHPAQPGGRVEEKTICKVTIDGHGHNCLILNVEKKRSLSEQYEVVDRERKHLEDRGVHCMNSLYMNQVDQPQPGNAYEVPNLANAVVLPLPVPRQPESVVCQHSTPDQNVEQPSAKVIQKSSRVSQTTTAKAPRFSTVPKTPEVTQRAPTVLRITSMNKPSSSTALRMKRASSLMRYSSSSESESESESEADDETEDESEIHEVQQVTSRTRAKSVGPSSSVAARAPSQVHMTFPSIIPRSASLAARTNVNLAAVSEQLSLHAKTLRRAVTMAMEELFTEDELINGVCTEQALKASKNLGVEEGAVLLDQGRLSVAHDLVAKWKRQSTAPGTASKPFDMKSFRVLVLRNKKDAWASRDLPAQAAKINVSATKKRKIEPRQQNSSAKRRLDAL